MQKAKAKGAFFYASHPTMMEENIMYDLAAFGKKHVNPTI